MHDGAVPARGGAVESATGTPIRVGTRGSALARTQTGWVVEQLRRLGVAANVEIVSTEGDVRTDVPIAAIGGDGVFVRELERALLQGRIDAAVHSLKDLPTEETAGLVVACVPVRATPFDALVGRSSHPPGTPCTLEMLPPGAVVGTSSVRRVAQVKAVRGDLVVRSIRGNVDTRLRRLDAGEYDCLILAGAGLERLGLSPRVSQVLRPTTFWPAVSQGALGIQIRADDERMRRALAPLDDPATHDAARAERSCLAALAGGCLAPIGAWGRSGPDGSLLLGACVLEEKQGGVERVVAEAAVDSRSRAVSAAPESLGRQVADMLLRQGAAFMLDRMRGRTP
jgi:hydroxymethylbilane synthase